MFTNSIQLNFEHLTRQTYQQSPPPGLQGHATADGLLTMCCWESRICAQSLCTGFICPLHCSLCQPGNSAQVSEPTQESILPLLFVFPSFLELFSPSYAPCAAVSGSIACHLPRYRARLLAKLHFPLIQRSTSLCLLRLSLSKACGSLSDSVVSFPAAGVLQVKGSPLPLVSMPFFLSSS